MLFRKIADFFFIQNYYNSKTVRQKWKNMKKCLAQYNKWTLHTFTHRIGYTNYALWTCKGKVSIFLYICAIFLFLSDFWISSYTISDRMATPLMRSTHFSIRCLPFWKLLVVSNRWNSCKNEENDRCRQWGNSDISCTRDKIIHFFEKIHFMCVYLCMRRVSCYTKFSAANHGMSMWGKKLFNEMHSKYLLTNRFICNIKASLTVSKWCSCCYVLLRVCVLPVHAP